MQDNLWHHASGTVHLTYISSRNHSDLIQMEIGKKTSNHDTDISDPCNSPAKPFNWLDKQNDQSHVMKHE
jgi:hypothetical protein